MITEVTYEQLTEDQRALADKATILETETNLYLVDEFGKLKGYRAAEMFNAGKPVKFSAVLSLETGEPLPEKTKLQQAVDESIALVKGLVPKPEPDVRGAVRWVEIDVIDRCPLNPRVNFKRERLDELKQSIRAHGFIAEMSHLWVRPHPTVPGRFELVDGERRWIVVGELVRDENMRRLVPITVSELSDAQVLEFALVNARQREGLSPIEEAVAICRMMEMPKADGTLPTAEQAALALGCSAGHITNCRRLRRLHGTRAGEAIEDGRLTIRHGIVLGQIASSRQRDELTKRVLEPTDKRGLKAVEVEILQEWVEAEVQIDLRTARFDYEAAELVPLKLDDNGERQCGGACGQRNTTTKNMEWGCPFVEASKGRALCLNPDCFKAKEAARYELWRASVTGENVTTLPADEAAKLFDSDGRQLAPNSGYVDLNSRPESWELKAEITAVPTWKKLLRGSGVKMLVIKDRDDKVRELVLREIAKQVARDQLAANKEPDIFRGAVTVEAATEATTSTSDEGGDPRIEAAANDTKLEEERAAQQRAQVRQAEIEKRTDVQLHRELFDSSRGLKRLTSGFWWLVLAPMMEAVREGGHLARLCLALGKTDNLTNDVDNADKLSRMVRESDPVHLPSLALMIARFMLYPNEVEDWLKSATKEFQLDVKAIRKRMTTQVDEEARIEAERLEIEQGVAWMPPLREKVDEFSWLNDGGCGNANIATLALPGGKWTALVGTGRTHKGWHMGYALNRGTKVVKHAMANRNTVSYGNPALALKAALLGIDQALAEASAPQPVRDRIAAYVANVKMPDERPKPKPKPAKKPTKKLAGKIKVAPPVVGEYRAWKKLSKGEQKLVRKAFTDGEDTYHELFEFGFDAAGLPVDRVHIEDGMGETKDQGAARVRKLFKAGEKVTVATIQKRLKLGYTPASKIMDAMIDAGEIVGEVLAEKKGGKK